MKIKLTKVERAPEPEVSSGAARAAKVRGEAVQGNAKPHRPAAVPPVDVMEFHPFGVPSIGRASGAPTAAVTPGGIEAWSYSRYSTWRQCPFKAKCQFILKMREPDNAVMARGTAIHKLAELYATGEMSTLPKELKAFAKEFKVLRGRDPQCEGEWAFTRTWEETGWFAKGANAAWCRIKTDVTVVEGDCAEITDHKTGKPRDEHQGQLSLYGLGGFIKFPQVNRLKASLWYLDSGERADLEFTRDQLPLLKSTWNDKVAPMLADRQFAPRPTKSCCWCHFRKQNGGPCQY